MIKVLLISAFLLHSQHQGSAREELPGVEDYKVVFPQKLHVFHKRDVAGSQNPSNGRKYDDSMQYEIKVNGEKVILHLEKNKDLFAKDYSETHYSHDGREVTRSPEIKDHCFYTGHIQNDNDSEASISACSGLKGYFKSRGKRYLIQPLKFTDSEEHAVFKYENLENSEGPKTCGVTNTTWESEDPIKKSSRSSTSVEKQEYLKARKYVEVYIVVDNAVYRKYNHNTTSIRTRIFEIINYINMVYKAINIHVALIGLEIWSAGDLFIVTSSAGTTLDRFAEWRHSDLLKRKKNDNAQLLTGIDFDGPTVGLAFVGTMCSATHSSGIVQDHHINPISIGATMAHEMGHNFGMNHDTSFCKCSSESCIMAAQLSYNIPRDFSTCSLQEFQKYILNRTPMCITNIPALQDIIAAPVCGNNFVEEGEECDCGTPEECTNVCCEAMTCKLKPDAKCGFGECCENCQLKKAGAICRVKKHDCDLPELCTGQSHECPVDRFRVNGFPCQDGQGYCYMGKCPTLQSQCVALWGPGSTVAADACYKTNQNGVYYGHCKKANGTFMPCANSDIKCGKLFCTGGSQMPAEGNLLSFDSCKGSFLNNDDEDSGMVMTGTKCGDGMVCSRGQCVDIERAYKSTNCSAKCSGHAVCDHELQCQCEEGWAPPDCNSVTTIQYFAIIGVLAALAIIVIVIALFLRYRNTKKQQSHSGQSRGVSGETNPAFSGQEQKRRQHTAPMPPGQEVKDTRLLLPNPPLQASKPQVRVPIIKPAIPPPPVPAAKPAYPLPSKSVAETKSTPSPLPKGKPAPPPQALKPPVKPKV
ncbi:disintegrin and metalloproteinase domain-containing protein 28 [Carettochelys insculpta]|uniref:disintegrin and metalloproteinase domain-containing protein 28 n=1 Tax=Carettochelys insculpta TaxID=44489 RepID=UPI003EB711CE